MSGRKININVSGGSAHFENVVQGDGNSIATRAAEADAAACAPRVFISYRRLDTNQITGRIYDRLAAEFGSDRVFKDVYTVPPGEDFRHVVAREIARADFLLAVIGRHWLGPEAATPRILEDEDLVRLEIAMAMQHGLTVIPLLTAGAQMPVAAQLPAELQEFRFRNAIQFREDPDFEKDFERLLGVLSDKFYKDRDSNMGAE